MTTCPACGERKQVNKINSPLDRYHRMKKKGYWSCYKQYLKAKKLFEPYD